MLNFILSKKKKNTNKFQARSKLPKKRRRVMPVEQPRRKRDIPQTNRRTNALKHQHLNPTTQTHPPGGKDLFGTSKLGHVNGVNVINTQGSATAASSSAKPYGNPTSK